MQGVVFPGYLHTWTWTPVPKFILTLFLLIHNVFIAEKFHIVIKYHLEAFLFCRGRSHSEWWKHFFSDFLLALSPPSSSSSSKYFEGEFQIPGIHFGSGAQKRQSGDLMPHFPVDCTCSRSNFPFYKPTLFLTFPFLNSPFLKLDLMPHFPVDCTCSRSNFTFYKPSLFLTFRF